MLRKNKTWILIFILFLINNCSSLKNHPVKNTAPQNQTSRLQRALLYFDQGEKMLAEGDLKSSKFYFDRTIDILLDSNPKNPLEKQQLLNYIDNIAELELQTLQGMESHISEKWVSFLQEVIASSLFIPTEKEVSQIKQKIQQEKPDTSFPLKVNSSVVSFIQAFQTVRHSDIQNALNRSAEYQETFHKIFREYQLPQSLIYLPIIESGFRIKAVSRARAKGMWQFMASTARMFGLRVDWVVDERLDPFKSAVAAAKYLKCLYNEFGDWYLVLACYNGGTRRVRRAISRLETRDFFAIARTRYLRRETRNYVPAFLASLIIARAPRDYGFSIEKETSLFNNTITYEIPSPVELKEVSQKAGVPLQELKTLNPELIRDFTPFDSRHYQIRLPVSADTSQLSTLQRLPPEREYFVGWYRVRKGDNLYQIARRFNTTVHKIKKTNKLSSNLIKPGERLLIPR